MNSQINEKDKVETLVPPKGIGISRRLLVSLVGVMLLLALLFLMFIYQSSHRFATQEMEKNQHSQKGTETIDTDGATSLIQKLQHEQYKPHAALIAGVVNDQNVEKSNNNAVVTHTDLPMANNDFKQGSDSEISVYQSIAANPSNPIPSGATENATAGVGTSNKTMDDYAIQNNQSEKVAFLRSSQSSEKDYIQSQLKQPLLPYEIKAGTIIPAILMTGINSDLPGTIIAKVSRDVFDTATGNYLLIPQGTTLIGVYDSQIAYGQSRILIAWSRLIFPNGGSFDLEGQPGVDLVGMAGLHDLVNNHYAKIFGSALLFSAFGAADQLSQPQTSSDQLTMQQIMYAAMGQQMSQTGAQLIQKNMNIQPTIEIRPGANFNVLLVNDVLLSNTYKF